MKDNIKQNLLLIAYTFPPMAYAGTHRSLRFCRYLTHLGIPVTVLTIKVSKYAQNDPALLKNLGDQVEIVRTPIIDPWASYQPLKPKIMKNFAGKVTNKIISGIFYFLTQPDHMVLWIPFTVWRGVRLIKKKNINVIYTTVPPFSTLITGYLLKKLTGVDWIADFRDPIKDNMASKYWSSLTRRINFFLEEMVFRHADRVLTTTVVAKNKLVKRYGSQRVRVIYNSYDEDDFRDLPRQKSERFTIAHLGTIYMFRKADLIFKAIAQLKDEGVIQTENFLLSFIGLNDDSLKQEVAKHRLEDLVEIRGMVGHREALTRMVNANMLLLVKGFDIESAGQIPGKLFEYLGAGKDIIFLGPANSEAAEIVKKTNSGYVIEKNTNKLIKLLHNKIIEWNLNGKIIQDSSKRDVEYSSMRMAEKFAVVLEELSEKSK